MKVLLDTCVWGTAKNELRSAGHDVVWAGDFARDPGDEEILDQAHREQRVLVTLDKDFGELAIRRGLPHSGIVRIVNFSARQQGAVCQQVLSRYGDELARGAIDGRNKSGSYPTTRRRRCVVPAGYVWCLVAVNRRVMPA
jgi:predicted nuclease of predicted toxin-antitoxin system